MKAFAGHRLQVTGKFDNANDARVAAGQVTAKLPAEIEVSAFQEASASPVAERTATAQTPAQTPASVQARNESVRTAPQDANRGGLPRTASQRPLILLAGLLLLCVAVVLRIARTTAL